MADEVRGRLAPGELLDLSYESLVADPAGRLSEICTFVGVAAPADFLEACSATVEPDFGSAVARAEWSLDERRRVDELIAGRPVLAGYSFER